ncbi:hypothetical protein MNBD_GAMMA21-2296 [hydrothermal vent metagenome]|uniref:TETRATRICOPEPTIDE REPEAT FAMILY PROTEIN n=1 Tax=hydrothermal vent metagenome TaxID=652676 RepID=A0A3B1B3J3_9ZZZZ
MSKPLSRIGHLIFLGSLFIASPSLLIASDDWVQEKRFNEQLSQAGKGDTQAMYEVGRMYERGRGVDEDVSEAMRWYIKSADGGSDLAHARLGMIYFTGQGAAQDYPKARSHLTIAAKNNDPAAQYYLAMMFEQGKAVKRNTAWALALYKKSAAGGYYQARTRIARLKKTAKVKSVRLPSPPATPKSPASKLAKGLVQSILQGDWQRNGEPVGFLPSAGTQCKKNGNKIYKCRSQTMSRKSDDTIITYVTVATLSGFTKKDRFNITYRYNILRLQKEGAQEAKPEEDDDDDGDYSADPAQQQFTLKLGAQRTKHKLNCILKEERTLECIKNRTQKIEFNDRSGS